MISFQFGVQGCPAQWESAGGVLDRQETVSVLLAGRIAGSC